MRWGLDRMREMLSRLGHPERAFRSVHVGGTNGKGSAAAMLESVLRHEGRRTGLYTSPELLTFRDRIRIGGTPVALEDLEEPARRLHPLAREVEATYFEAVTALALLAFERAGVEIAVVEVGLGGRLDATNVLRPEVSLVTSLSRDHTNYLGESLEEIAREKAGILKPRVPVVLGPIAPPARRLVERRAAAVGAPLFRLGRDASVEAVTVGLEATSFTYRSSAVPEGRELSIPLPGEHQAANAGTALLALEQLPDPPGEAALRRGLRELRWPGRFQVVRRRGGTWILDAAHNRDAFGALVRTLGSVALPPPLVFVVSILGDKEWPEMLASLEPLDAAVVLTIAPSSPSSRRWDPERVARVLRARRDDDGSDARSPSPEPVLDFGRAMLRARELARDGTVVVAGSCHTAGDGLRWLGSEPSGDGHDRGD